MATVCKHCGKAIVQMSDGWVHANESTRQHRGEPKYHSPTEGEARYKPVDHKAAK